MMHQTEKKLRAFCSEPENYSAEGLAAIASFADLTAEQVTEEELIERIPDFDLLFVRVKTNVSRRLLEAATRLRAVVSPTTGLNHIDLEAAESMGIEVFHLRGQREFLRSIPSTAEHTWGLLLALMRNIPSAFDAVKAGRWDQDPFRGHEIHDKRLGILGFGRLGAMVAHYGRAFGMKVSTYDPYGPATPAYVLQVGTLPEFLAQLDILTIHVPLNDETKGMIGEAELAALPKGAVLVNTSRGEIIDESALVESLEAGHLAGAAVDVIHNELDPQKRDVELLAYARTHENLIVTPHVGGATFEAVAKTDLHLIGRVTDWLEVDQTDIEAAEETIG